VQENKNKDCVMKIYTIKRIAVKKTFFI